MGLCSFSSELIINNKLELDNIFVNEFLPYAPEGTVKVYIYGLYMCSHSNAHDNTLESFAKVLSMSEQDILDSFLYWQEQGLVQVLSTYPVSVKYMPLKNFINNSKKFNKDKYSTFNAQAQEIITGRMITPNEYTEYYTVIESFHIEPEALLMIMSYCVGLKGTNVGHAYITTVAKNWAQENITTTDKVEERLKEFELIGSDVADIFKALGSKRKPTHEDNELFTKWTKNLGFDKGAIIYVAKASRKKNPRFSFEMLDGKVHYLGLSLFDTVKNAYTGNLLCSEEEKVEIMKKYISEVALLSARQKIIDIVEPALKENYNGPFGVDMMIAAKDGQLELVSCVELNLRRTMGHVALELAKITKPQSLMRVDFDGNRYHLRVLPGKEAVNES